MTDNRDSLPEPGEDAALNEAFARLKQWEPPLETRVANRMAVAAALAELNRVTHQRRLPWWRRSISIPVPIAASVAVLAALVLPLSLRGWKNHSPSEADATSRARAAATDRRTEMATIVKRAPNQAASWKYYETETYLCGVGRLNSETHYSIEE